MQTFSTGQQFADTSTKLKSLIMRCGHDGEIVLGEAAHRKLIVLIRKGGNLYGKVVKRVERQHHFERGSEVTAWSFMQKIMVHIDKRKGNRNIIADWG